MGLRITPERFAQGMTYDEYKAQMTQRQDEFVAHERDCAIDPNELAAFKRLDRPLHVLVLDEDWCDDGAWMFPILGRVAEASGMLNIRVFLRDQNLDLMEQCLNQGVYQSIPVFVFLDADFNEVGRFIERPASITDLRESGFAYLIETCPEFAPLLTSPALASEEVRDRAMQVVRAFVREYTPLLVAEAVRDLRMIVERQNVRALIARETAAFV